MPVRQPRRLGSPRPPTLVRDREVLDAVAGIEIEPRHPQRRRRLTRRRRELGERHDRLCAVTGVDAVGVERRIGGEAHGVAGVEQLAVLLVHRDRRREGRCGPRHRDRSRSTRPRGARTAQWPPGTTASACAPWCAISSARCEHPSPRAGSASRRRAGSSGVRAHRCSRSSTHAPCAAGSRDRCARRRWQHDSNSTSGCLARRSSSSR